MIVFLLYAVLCCVPAFLLCYEAKDWSDWFKNIDLYLIIITFIGFPGTIIAVIAKNIKKSQTKREEKEILERRQAEDKKNKQKLEQAEQKRKNEINNKIEYYKKSSLMPPIISFLKQKGTINKIEIHFDRINVIYTGGHDEYIFCMNEINDFQKPDIFSFKMKAGEMYCFGCAINQLLGNFFEVTEKVKFIEFKRYDGDLEIGIDLEYVTLSRLLRTF